MNVFQDYHAIVHMLMNCATWNVNGMKPDELDTERLVEYLKRGAPRYAVLGLQEVVPTTWNGVNGAGRLGLWREFMARAMGDGWSVKRYGKGGVGMVVCMRGGEFDVRREDVVEHVIAGNMRKGSVFVPLMDSRVIVGCSHFRAHKGDKHAVKRANDYSRSKRGLRLMGGENVPVVWMGDFNSRMVDYGGGDGVKLDRDEIKRGVYFRGWKEGSIDFPPTYKYKGAEYSRKRERAWCDRVMFRGRGVSAKDYVSQPPGVRGGSDHAWVGARLEVQ